MVARARASSCTGASAKRSSSHVRRLRAPPGTSEATRWPPVASTASRSGRGTRPESHSSTRSVVGQGSSSQAISGASSAAPNRLSPLATTTRWVASIGGVDAAMTTSLSVYSSPEYSSSTSARSASPTSSPTAVRTASAMRISSAPLTSRTIPPGISAMLLRRRLARSRPGSRFLQPL